jgi:hypothetical protein
MKLDKGHSIVFFRSFFFCTAFLLGLVALFLAIICHYFGWAARFVRYVPMGTSVFLL